MKDVGWLNPDCIVAEIKETRKTGRREDVPVIPQSNPKQQYGDLKLKHQLVPAAAMNAIARGLEEGAKKYGPYNWRDQPVELMTYVGATLRHLFAWIEGEEIDPDSKAGKHHLDGAIADLAIIIDAIKADTFIDNRPRVKNKGALDDLKTGARKDLK